MVAVVLSGAVLVVLSLWWLLWFGGFAGDIYVVVTTGKRSVQTMKKSIVRSEDLPARIKTKTDRKTTAIAETEFSAF